MTKARLLERARYRADAPGDGYWDNLIRMVSPKSGIGITNRGEYSQNEWNWLTQAKSALWEPGAGRLTT